MKPLRGKRVGSAQSARGIQLGGPGDAARCGRISFAGTSPRCRPAPRRAHFLRGGASRPAPVRPGRVRGRRWLAASAVSFTAPPRLEFRRLPGPRTMLLAAPSLHVASEALSFRPSPARGAVVAVGGPRGRGSGGTGPPRPRRDCRPGRTVLSAPQPRRAASGRGPAHA